MKDQAMSKKQKLPVNATNTPVASHPAEHKGHEELPVAEHVRGAGPEAMRDAPGAQLG